ncbi:MAG TPA: 50S ribosomal protein L25 [Phycisphaerae bacterium]|nr:50S ribosomal protein L25 [Phycisphaerae bacterium]
MALLKASTRGEIGTRRVRLLRDKGLIPAIIYGHNELPQPVTLGEHDLELALQHGERLLQVDVDGQVQNVLVKDVQWDTFGHVALHVDLFRVSLDDRVEVTVPVILRGTPAGEADGGVLQQSTMDITIECTVVSIPEEIRVRVNDLKVDDSLQLKDIALPEGMTLLDDGDIVLCTCSVVAEEAEPEPEEGAAQPEVIGEKKEAEGEGPSSE